MAKIVGVSVLGREIEPGDIIENEWDHEILVVKRVELIRNKEVNLYCERADFRTRIIRGNWDGTTRLIARLTPAFQPDYTPHEHAMMKQEGFREEKYSPSDCAGAKFLREWFNEEEREF